MMQRVFTLLDQVVQWAHQENLYVILDMHAAPGGQTGKNIDDSDGYPWLFSDASAQQHTIAIWQRVARHYRNDATVLGYDLLNEPIPNYPGLEQYNASLEPFYKQLTTAVRQVDAHHVLIFGGAQWDNNFFRLRAAVRQERRVYVSPLPCSGGAIDCAAVR